MEFLVKSNVECPGCHRHFSEMGLRAHTKFCKNDAQHTCPLKPKHLESDTVTLGNSDWHEFLDCLRHCRYDDPFQDITVVTSERDILTCHCVILAAASPVWADLLDLASREDESVLIVSENMSTNIWKKLLDLLYTGKVIVEKEMLQGLKEILEIYSIKFSVEAENNVKEEDLFEPFDIEPIDSVEIELKTDTFLVEGSYKRTADNSSHIGYSLNGKEEKLKIVKASRGKINNGNVPAETVQCDYCHIKKPSLLKIKGHVRKSHHEKMEQFSDKYEHYGCDMCSKRFIKKKMVWRHKKDYHPNYTRLKKPRVLYPEDGFPWVANRQCPCCPKILKTIAKFDDHLKTHSAGQFPYSCNDCNFKCQRAVSFRNHINKHQLLEHPLLCTLCGQAFFTEFELHKHVIKEHPKRKPKKLENEPSTVAEQFLCNLCGQAFAKKSAWCDHIRFAHVKEEDKFHCTECEFKTANIQNFKRHNLLHKPPSLQCNHCERMFHTEVYRRNHIKNHHTADHLKDFTCEQCGKGFTNKDSYNGHMNMHQGLKPFKCRYCDMCYQNHSNRMAHEKKNHPELYTKRQKQGHLGGIRITKR